MAHNLYKNSMVYTGDLPWHRLGVAVANVFTAAEALRLGKVDYLVNQKPIHCEGREVEGWKANVNGDTGDVLGIVGSRYKVLQNRDAFDFFDVLTGEGKAVYETVGALGKGERVWILAKTDLCINVKLAGGDDRIDSYLLLTNSHDGSSPVSVLFTPIRVVCQNTLTAALSSGKKSKQKPAVVVRHSGDVVGKVRAAGEIMRASAEYFASIGGTFQKFASVTLTDEELSKYLAKVLGDPAASGCKRIQNMREELIGTVRGLVTNGRGADLPGVRGTLWAAYNGVTEYVDYKREVRGEGDRTESILFGGGQEIKQAAFDAAVALVS